MANSIALFKKYIDLLSEVYKSGAKTSVLDIDGTLVQAGANANEIIIPKISMDGLADYSRNGGYVGGNSALTYETVKFNYDRGRKFFVDAMDNQETVGQLLNYIITPLTKFPAAVAQIGQASAS